MEVKLAAAEETRKRREASRAAIRLPDACELRIGDARQVLADVADNSVPLVLTDPPYGKSRLSLSTSGLPSGRPAS